MWLLYQLATALALLVAGPFLLVRRGGHYLETLPGRLGAFAERRPEDTEPNGFDLWIHAVSVGEVSVAAALVAPLPREISILVTTITPTGQKRARQLLANRARVAYLPFDLGPTLERFWRRHQPRSLVLIEGETWPLLLAIAKRRGLPSAIVNGRLSDRSFARLRRAPWIARFLYRDVQHIGVQTDEDRARLVELGVDAGRILVTGNLKYETPEPPRLPELEEALRALAGDRPLLVAGSTMAGEEELAAAAFEVAGGSERALLLLAPRHPERCLEVERLLADRGHSVRRRSRLDDSPSGLAARSDIVLLDTVGELASLYRLALGVFIGGTLVPSGGHNPIEPARLGVAVAVGPSLHNFREIAEHFDRAQAWARVRDETALGALWRTWLDDPELARSLGRKGAALIASHRGALARTLALLAPVLAARAARYEAPGRPR
jgi:3-deoxy-D-manno-octulosonic-acid transferase